MVLELLFVERRGNEREKKVLREENLNISRRYVGAHTILCRRRSFTKAVTEKWLLLGLQLLSPPNASRKNYKIFSCPQEKGRKFYIFDEDW